MRKLPIVQIIGNTLFVHAGVHSEWLNVFGFDIDKINNFTQTYFDCKASHHPNCEDVKQCECIDRFLNTRIFDPQSSEFINTLNNVTSDVLHGLNMKYAAIGLNVNRITTGHNTIDNISWYHNHRNQQLLCVDTGYWLGQWEVAVIDVENNAVSKLKDVPITQRQKKRKFRK